MRVCHWALLLAMLTVMTRGVEARPKRDVNDAESARGQNLGPAVGQARNVIFTKAANDDTAVKAVSTRLNDDTAVIDSRDLDPYQQDDIALVNQAGNQAPSGDASGARRALGGEGTPMPGAGQGPDAEGEHG